MSPDKMLTVKKLAGLLGISTRTIWRAVKSGHLPPPHHPSKRSSRWLWAEVESYMKAQEGG